MNGIIAYVLILFVAYFCFIHYLEEDSGTALMFATIWPLLIAIAPIGLIVYLLEVVSRRIKEQE